MSGITRCFTFLRNKRLFALIFSPPDGLATICLPACSLACVFAFLLACLLASLLACLLTYLLARLLAFCLLNGLTATCMCLLVGCLTVAFLHFIFLSGFARWKNKNASWLTRPRLRSRGLQRQRYAPFTLSVRCAVLSRYATLTVR